MKSIENAIRKSLGKVRKSPDVPVQDYLDQLEGDESSSTFREIYDEFRQGLQFLYHRYEEDADELLEKMQAKVNSLGCGRQSFYDRIQQVYGNWDNWFDDSVEAYFQQCPYAFDDLGYDGGVTWDNGDWNDEELRESYWLHMYIPRHDWDKIDRIIASAAQDCDDLEDDGIQYTLPDWNGWWVSASVKDCEDDPDCKSVSLGFYRVLTEDNINIVHTFW